MKIPTHDAGSMKVLALGQDDPSALVLLGDREVVLGNEDGRSSDRRVVVVPDR
jgi:hypothetical protein